MLETVSEEQSLWRGECFVFDQRVSVTHGLQKGTAELCRGCRRPLMPTDREHSSYQEGVCCAFCADELSEETKAKNLERDLQIRLAAERNSQHLGYIHGPHQLDKNRAKIVE